MEATKSEGHPEPVACILLYGTTSLTACITAQGMSTACCNNRKQKKQFVVNTELWVSLSYITMSPDWLLIRKGGSSGSC